MKTIFTFVLLFSVCAGAAAPNIPDSFEVRELPADDGASFEVISRANGHSVKLDAKPLFNVSKNAFVAAQADFEIARPKIEARLFDCSKRQRCLQVWRAPKGEGGKDAKWLDADRLQFTLVRVVNGAYLAITHTCSLKKKSCDGDPKTLKRL